tara:strand:- start:4089 stop:5672 length:1584 start_codon:yes stop_codon:yes gene_type:complete
VFKEMLINTNMHDSLLNTLELINEDVTLSASQINKYQARFDKFIEMIRTGMAFYTVDREAVIAEPSEADRFQELKDEDQFKGTIKIKLETGEELPISKLLKTPDLGGQAIVGQDEGESTEEVGKETAVLKPSQIGITDKDIPASNLGQEIIANDSLNSTEYGKVVVQMAIDIMEGKNPIIPDDIPPKIRASIHDYAGEYLGVLALIEGTSRFPRRRSFEEWLGGSISDLIINFPSSANTNIADSFAAIKNTTTNHTINISSKGKGGGAPPSISGLKIPDSIKENPDFEASMKFIEICQSDAPIPTPKTVSSVFYAMNVLARYKPDAIPDKFKPFLPFNDQTIDEASESVKAFKTQNPIEMEEYASLWADTDFKKPSSDGGKLTYVIKKAVMEAVNEGGAFPEFQQVILEILDMNFIQQYADVSTKKGPKVMTFATQWPAKLEGKVSLESKSGATDPTKGGFSFKLANTPPKTVIDEPSEGDGEEVKMNDTPKTFDKDTKALAKGGSKDVTDIFKKRQPTKGVGRNKR